MRTDVFGDLTVHGSFVSTNSMVFQDDVRRARAREPRAGPGHPGRDAVAKDHGLDSEDGAATPTSTLTLDVGPGRQ